MPTLEQEKTIREALKTALTTLVNVDPKSLAREAELGTTLSFAEAIPYFERILNLYKQVESVVLDDVSYGAINNVLGGANDALNLFKGIREFNPQQVPNPNDARKSLVNSARELYESHYTRISPVLAFATRKGPDFNALESKAVDAVGKISKLSTELTQQGEKYKSSAENTLQKLQEAAGKVGVARHAVNFEEQASEHLNAAHWWFAATLGFVLIGVVAVWALFIGPFKLEVKDLKLGEAIYSVASRLMAFSIISFAIYWAAKNHGAHRHNYVVNKHRQNALATFQAFIEAAQSDQDVKNAVLLQAGQAIYAAQPTGYSEAVSAPASPVSMIELIKCASSKS